MKSLREREVKRKEGKDERKRRKEMIRQRGMRKKEDRKERQSVPIA